MGQVQECMKNMVFSRREFIIIVGEGYVEGSMQCFT